MTSLVIGCGSIGKRHINNLIKIKAGKILVFDTERSRLRKVKKIDGRIGIIEGPGRLLGTNPEVVFICTPPSSHIGYALMWAKKNSHLFIEKPLSSNLRGVSRLIEIAKSKRLITFVGCNMRFYWAIKKIKELLEKNLIGKVVSARLECGHFLPDWHPWEDYRRMYSAKKLLGGGVIFDAIHEIDYAIWFFGLVKDLICMYGKLSNLEIETEDLAEILLKFNDGPLVNIHLDYIQRNYSRSCKIIGEEGTIFWNFNDHLVSVDSKKLKKRRIFCEPQDYDINEMYIDELKYFLNCVRKRQGTFNDISQGFKTLKIALLVKKKGINV